MTAWAWMVAVAALGVAGGVEAGGFAPATTVTSVTTVPASTADPAALEWVRYDGPQVGRNVTVEAGGALVPGIEWHRDIQIRVRTKSGALLTPDQQAGLLANWQTCRRGEARGAMGRVEPNGTYVIDYDCAWLQGS